MDPQGWLTERFEEKRPLLRGVAYRMLGSLSEAEDAVQETWLRLNRSETATIENLGGWLTTVVSRVCLDMLRSRKSRREGPIDAQVTARSAVRGEGADPEAEALLADSVGVALLVVLDALTPAERLAFVLHDLFALPFDEVGSIMGRSAAAAKQLASRARRRVRGPSAPSDARTAEREVVDAFMRAVRAGDLEGLLAVLDPDAVLHIDGAARMAGGGPHAEDTPREIRGASNWARQMIALTRGQQYGGQAALIDGSVGVVVAPGGRLSRVLVFSFANGRITRLEAIGDRARLRAMDLAVL